MNNNAIGIFDSGIGGLSCVGPISRLMPNEKIIYFGDSARAPYGVRTDGEIIRFSEQIANCLIENGAKMLVIACNTISAVAAGKLKKKFPDTPIIGVTQLCIEELAQRSSKDQKIGVIATPATVASGIYPKSLFAKRPELEIHQLACPKFVEMVEAGNCEGEDAEAQIKAQLNDFVYDNKLDTMVLGCTHFPHLQKSIHKLYPDLALFDPAEALAKAVSSYLDENGLRADDSPKESILYSSRLTDSFVQFAKLSACGNFRIEEKQI